MNELTKANKITVGGGLHGRIKAAEVLKEIAPQVDVRTFPNRLSIICDLSGSMEEGVSGRWSDDSRKSKLDLLKEAVQDFSLRSNPADTAIAVESFPRGFRIDLTNDNQQIYMRMMGAGSLGSTPMSEGMYGALDNHSPTRAMLISDGDHNAGDDPYRAAEKYKAREIIIDTVHIGDSSRGEEALKRIASITGGMYLKFKDVSSFSQNFHYLLPESRAQLAGMLPYEVERLLGANEVK
jgi:Mg-chelatase subunit ChlD